MTNKKDFELIAKALQWTCPIIFEDWEFEEAYTFKKIVTNIAREIKVKYPKFNYEKFIKMCYAEALDMAKRFHPDNINKISYNIECAIEGVQKHLKNSN
jgi:hypothetical protein